MLRTFNDLQYGSSCAGRETVPGGYYICQIIGEILVLFWYSFQVQTSYALFLARSPFRDALFLARSPDPTSFDAGCILTNASPIILDDEIRFYYGGYDQGATGADDTKLISGIGLATIPRGRFAGISPVEYSDQQTLLTPLEHIGQVTLKPLDLSRIECHVKPLLGKRTVTALTLTDIERFQSDIAAGKTAKPRPNKGRTGNAKGGRGVATRTVGMLGTILEFARRHNIITENPARGVRRYPDQKSRRFLSVAEIGALGKVMREAEGENQTGIAATRALLLTGCRKMEILSFSDFLNKFLNICNNIIFF